MVKRITLVLAILMLILVGTSALAKVSAPDWANVYGVENIQRTALYQFFNLDPATLTGEERLGGVFNLGGSGMMLQKSYDMAIDGDKIYGTVEDKDIGEVNVEEKGIRTYDFEVSPTVIKGTIAFKYRPKTTIFDLSFQGNKLVGTATIKKKVVSNYDITFGDDGAITGTMGVKGDVHTVDLKLVNDEVKGTIKGSKKYGNGNYAIDFDMMVPQVSREKISFLMLVLLHQEALTDFYRNVDFDLPYHAHGDN